jgi:hypothetical protein
MNKKILAVAALALIATSGLASAQTVRQQPRLEREAPVVRSLHNSNAAIFSQGGRSRASSWVVEPRHPGDNSYDDTTYGSKVGGNS